MSLEERNLPWADRRSFFFSTFTKQMYFWGGSAIMKKIVSRKGGVLIFSIPPASSPIFIVSRVNAITETFSRRFPKGFAAYYRG